MVRDTRTALMDAAQESFATKGFGGASIRQLAGAVGIKESSLYNHFSGKQDLLDAVLDRAQARLASVAEGLQVPFDDPAEAVPIYEAISLERLGAMAEAFLRAWLTDPEVVAARRVLTLEQYRTPEAGRRLRELLVEAPLAFQAELFGALMERGLFRPAPAQAAALAFWGPILAILTAAEGGGVESDEDEGREGEERDGAQVADRAVEQAVERLRLHLSHFTATHVVSGARKEEGR